MKLSKELFEAQTKENQAILRKIGLEVEEDNVPSPRKPKMEKSVLESYACIVETECKLCKTTTITVFAMEGAGGLLLSKQSTIEAVEGMTVRTRNETVLTCPACHDVLKLMGQEDLIALCLKAAKGDCRLTKRSN